MRLQSNHQYVKSLMTLAAKKDRKYYGLANMDLPEPFTPYQAYAMVQLAVEDGVLDPKDFKAKAWTLPSAARTGLTSRQCNPIPFLQSFCAQVFSLSHALRE